MFDRLDLICFENGVRCVDYLIKCFPVWFDINPIGPMWTLDEVWIYLSDRLMQLITLI